MDTKRQDNWTDHETVQLLDAVEQVQTIRGKVEFSFKTPEMETILRLFKEKILETVRDNGKLSNRLKVLLKRFRVCHELVNRSSGSWDERLHRPSAPSQLEYIEMVKSKGEPAKFLLKHDFPWYLKMEPMVAGQTSRGDWLKTSIDEAEPSLRTLPTQGSNLGSEQGSSDDPEEFHSDNDGSDSIQQQFGSTRHKYSGGRGGRQSSEGTFPASQSSGSKRRSRDESTGEERSTRGKKYKDSARNKLAQGRNEILHAGLEIAKSMRAESGLLEGTREEKKKCLEKINQLCLGGAAEDFIMAAIENDTRRMWFMSAADHQVYDWLNRNNLFNNQDHANLNPSGFSTMFNNNVARGGYNNPNQGGNNYGYPSPSHSPNL